MGAQEEDLRDARDALARQTPQLAASVNIATVTLVPIVELLAAEAREEEAGRRRDAVRNAGRVYAEQIDSLLRNSAETRADLGALIENIMAGELTAAQSLGQITAIASQRQGLQNSVSAIEGTPPMFRRSAELLRLSIRASFEDDIAIQGWITAWLEGDSYGIDRFWSEHETATARASADKTAFVAAYNDARKRVGLAPSIVGTTY